MVVRKSIRSNSGRQRSSSKNHIKTRTVSPFPLSFFFAKSPSVSQFKKSLSLFLLISFSFHHISKKTQEKMKAKTNQKIYSATDREELTRTDISNRVCSNTRSKYRSGVKKFLEYCESRNLDAIPTEINLCHFISETAREINPNSAGSYLSGIVHHFAETFPEVREIRLSMKVKNTLKGCKKTFSKPVKRAEALTLSDIEAAAKFFDSTFDDLS